MRPIIGVIVLTTIPIASLYWWNHIDNQMRVFDIIDGELKLFPSNIIATTFIFVTDDCPISNRYVPEVQRLTKYFQPLGIDFHLVYVKPNISKEEIKKH